MVCTLGVRIGSVSRRGVGTDPEVVEVVVVVEPMAAVAVVGRTQCRGKWRHHGRGGGRLWWVLRRERGIVLRWIGREWCIHGEVRCVVSLFLPQDNDTHSCNMGNSALS